MRFPAAVYLALSASVVCGWSGETNSGEAGLSLGEVVVDASGTAVLELTFLSGDQAIAAMQLDISYQNPTLSLSVSPTAFVNGQAKSIWSANPQPGVMRLLIAGLNQSAIAGGVIATVSVEAGAGTSPGVYALDVSGAIASSPDGSPVPLTANSGGVVVPGAGVLAPSISGAQNAASYAAGPVAPGEIIVIEGTSLAGPTMNPAQITSADLLATVLGGTSVFFDDLPAPLLYTTANQVSAIVPYEMGGQTQTNLQVEYLGILSAPVALPVALTAPAIFTLNKTGQGQGAIVNQDGSVNGPANPAARGDVVSIYGTGEGQTAPPGIDGLIVTGADLRKPLEAVTVTIGGRSAEVLYAGSAGNEVAGLLQVNAVVPTGIAPGPAVPVTIFIGQISQASVTMAVE